MSIGGKHNAEIALLLRVQDQIGDWLRKCHDPATWLSRKIFALIPVLLPTILFVWGVFFSDQGRDLLRSAVGQFWPAAQLAIALSLFIALACACIPSFAFTSWEVESRATGRRFDIHDLIYQSNTDTMVMCGFAAFLSMMASYIVALVFSGTDPSGTLMLAIAGGGIILTVLLTYCFRFLLFAYRAKWPGLVGIAIVIS